MGMFYFSVCLEEPWRTQKSCMQTDEERVNVWTDSKPQELRITAGMLEMRGIILSYISFGDVIRNKVMQTIQAALK